MAACSATQPTLSDLDEGEVDQLPNNGSLDTNTDTDPVLPSDPADGKVSVAITHSGPGRIVSTPAGIDCGGGATTCSARFAPGDIVLATDDTTTVRWGGACSGNGDCALTLAADQAVTSETFAPVRYIFDGSDHGQDSCFAIAAGPDGLVYATGEVQNRAVGHNIWVRAWNASGDVVWSHEEWAGGEGHDAGYSIAARADGTIHVAGVWYSGSPTRWNAFGMDLSTTGQGSQSSNELMGDDAYYATAIGPDGRVYSAGYRSTSGRAQAWAHGGAISLLRPGTGTGAAAATGIAVDGAGGVIVVGYEVNAATGTDGWLTKFTANGAIDWGRQFTGAGAATDRIWDVATGPESRVAIVGSVDGQNLLQVYSEAGTELWRIDGGPAGTVTFDRAGNVITAGSETVAKYSPDGALIWKRATSTSTSGVVVDSNGTIRVCGSANNDGVIVGFPQ